MQKIYSKVNGKLIHQINRLSDITPGRRDLSEDREFLQISTLNLPKDKTFFPHKHVWKETDGRTIAQESWICIKGSVKCILYDIDNTIIEEVILYPGDASMTFYGGHNYLILENETIVYEVKTGPYLGQAMDKVQID